MWISTGILALLSLPLDVADQRADEVAQLGGCRRPGVDRAALCQRPGDGEVPEHFVDVLGRHAVDLVEAVLGPLLERSGLDRQLQPAHRWRPVDFTSSMGAPMRKSPPSASERMVTFAIRPPIEGSSKSSPGSNAMRSMSSTPSLMRS